MNIYGAPCPTCKETEVELVRLRADLDRMSRQYECALILEAENGNLRMALEEVGRWLYKPTRPGYLKEIVEEALGREGAVSDDKACKRCGTVKPLGEFRQYGLRASDYQPSLAATCKSCENELGKLRREAKS